MVQGVEGVNETVYKLPGWMYGNLFPIDLLMYAGCWMYTRVRARTHSKSK